jgi:hypothetical protein
MMQFFLFLISKPDGISYHSRVSGGFHFREIKVSPIVQVPSIKSQENLFQNDLPPAKDSLFRQNENCTDNRLSTHCTSGQDI